MDMEPGDDRQHDFLCIGDRITLHDASRGYVNSDGFADEQCGVSHVTAQRQFPRRCVFVVRQQQSYSVAGMLTAMIEKQGITLDEARVDARNARLFREREQEKQRNLTEFEAARGRPVRYGMVVQLQHDTSFKYMRVSRQAALAGSTHGSRVVLDRDAGEWGWFVIQPRLRMHTEGERVHAGDPVVLLHVKSALRLVVDGTQLREGSADVSAEPRYELVAAPPKTAERAPGIKMQMYRPAQTHALGATTLLTNQPIRLHHKELDGYVTALTSGTSWAEGEAVGVRPGGMEMTSVRLDTRRLQPIPTLSPAQHGPLSPSDNPRPTHSSPLA